MPEMCPRTGDSPAANSDGTCGSCGSLTPTQVFGALVAGAKIKPGPKNFRMELEGEHAPATTGPCVFYFQHFSKEERNRFSTMLGAGELSFVDPPGQFFRPPFFIRSPS